jgi:O-antigen/teichoic acid export membrane protein
MITGKKEHSLKVNLIFSALYQVLILIIPFITAPYISRVLLPTGVGSYSYSYSYVTFFVTLATFGTLDYGTVIIAKKEIIKKPILSFFGNC